LAIVAIACWRSSEFEQVSSEEIKAILAISIFVVGIVLAWKFGEV
jgi:hypothetical protein